MRSYLGFFRISGLENCLRRQAGSRKKVSQVTAEIRVGQLRVRIVTSIPGTTKQQREILNP